MRMVHAEKIEGLTPDGKTGHADVRTVANLPVVRASLEPDYRWGPGRLWRQTRRQAWLRIAK
jgi:hypothetical protein